MTFPPYSMQPKILLVEDEPTLREALSELLAMHGYAVQAANDGVEGFDKAVELHPDLIISDMRMPRMDGPTMRARLRSHEMTADIPVVFISGFSPEFDVPANEVLPKPFTIEQLIGRIACML